jgi:alpha-N-arabinofuranosidase
MNVITSTGHADFFPDASGKWWAVFLAIRYSEHGFHPLGRETCLAPVDWTADGWPVVNGGRLVTERMEVACELSLKTSVSVPCRDDFDSAVLGPDWVRLRLPTFSDYSLNVRPGWLILRCAAPTLDQLASPAAVFRRLRHFEATARALIDFEPISEHVEAGLTILVDHRHHAELVIAIRGGYRVAIVRRRIGSLVGESAQIQLSRGVVEISLIVDRTLCRFFAKTLDGVSQEIGRHEIRYLSTEVAGGYTGVMLGLFASGRGADSSTFAAFDWFDYMPVNP